MTSFVSLPDELITLILSLSTIEDLLCSFQLVNKQFRNIIQTAPAVLKKLTFMPSDVVPELRTNDMRAENGIASEKLQEFRNDVYDIYHINPLIHSVDLFQLFSAYIDEHDHNFEDRFLYWDRGWSRHLSSKTPWLADLSKRDRWLRKDASWRKFLVRPHTQTVIRRLDVCSQAFNILDDDPSNYRRGGFIEFGSQDGPPTDGMTFGDFYDLVTIPELGLFRKGLRHSLAWRLRWDKTWAAGKSEEYDDIPGRACVYIYHVSEDGRDEQYKPDRPEQHGVKIGLQQKSDETKDTDSDQNYDPIEALAVQGYQSIIDSGRLRIHWGDDYFTACTWDPNQHCIYTEMLSKFGPEKIAPFIMRYSEDHRYEWSRVLELSTAALRLCREEGVSIIVERSNYSE